jgi:hypothetical protein
MTQNRTDVLAREAADWGRRVGHRVAGVLREYEVTGRQLAATLASHDGRPRHESYVSRRLRGRDLFSIDELYVAAALCTARRPDLPAVTLARFIDVEPPAGDGPVTHGYPATAAA